MSYYNDNGCCDNYDGAPIHSESNDTPAHMCDDCACGWCGEDTYAWGIRPVSVPSGRYCSTACHNAWRESD